VSAAVERRIAALARQQHGLVTRAQLLAAGLRPGAVDRRLRGARLRALHRGVYLVGPLALPRTPLMAAVLACGPGALLSHGTAASLWDLVPGRGAGDPLDVAVPGGDRRRPGIRIHRIGPLAPAERTELDGIPVTTPARTLLDLAGTVAGRELEQAIARGERAGLVTARELAGALSRRRGRPGAAALRLLLDAAHRPALTRSEAEERFLALVRQAGLPAPEVNVRVGPFELDFLWRAAGLAVEVDGFRFHASPAAFERDRRRDARLAARGIQVIRLSWRQVADEGLVTAVQVAQALVAPRRRE
jgi:very-short-patch-repair endonuclease